MTSSRKTEQLFYAVCDQLETATCGVAHLCSTATISYTTFRSFVRPSSPQYDQSMADRLRQAQDEQRIYLAETILTLTGELQDELKTDSAAKTTSGLVQALKLRIDAIKWYLAKTDPAQYGDNTDATTPAAIAPTIINILEDDAAE